MCKLNHRLNGYLNYHLYNFENVSNVDTILFFFLAATKTYKAVSVRSSTRYAARL